MTVWEELLPLTKRLYGDCVDLGCGNGDYSKRLASLPGVTSVTSVDITMVDDLSSPYAHGSTYRQNNPDRRFVLQSIDNLSMLNNDEFDCAMAWHVIEHVENTERALAEIKRVTKHLVMFALPIAVPGREAMYRSPDHVRWWTTDEFRAALERAGYFILDGPYIDQTTSMNWLTTVGTLDRFGITEVKLEAEPPLPPGRMPPTIFDNTDGVEQRPGPVVVRRKRTK